MPNPKFRISAARRDRRRSHLALKANPGSTCANCGSVRQPHRVCPSCGHYKGKQVIEASAKDLAIPDSFDTNS